MRISDWSSDVCSSDLIGYIVFDQRLCYLIGNDVASVSHARQVLVFSQCTAAWQVCFFAHLSPGPTVLQVIHKSHIVFPKRLFSYSPYHRDTGNKTIKLIRWKKVIAIITPMHFSKVFFLLIIAYLHIVIQKLQKV